MVVFNWTKNFIKELTSKLLEWTGERWIITLSKTEGDISFKEKFKKEKDNEIENIKKSKLYSNLKNKFSDIKLIDIINKKEKN